VRKPFSPEREKTNANPGSVETSGGVSLEIQRIDNKQDPRADVHALIKHRIALGLFQGDECVRDQIRNCADPAESFNEEVYIHNVIIKSISVTAVNAYYGIFLKNTTYDFSSVLYFGTQFIP